METCDIYIKSVLYNNQGWIDDPDIVLEQISNNLSEIPQFYFTSLSMNMSQVYNVSLKVSNYDSMMVYLKHAKFKHDQFLTLLSTQDLIDQIKQQLNYIEGLTFGNIEVRNSKLYTDSELGVL